MSLRLKCSKFDFGWGCAPDPTGELKRPLAKLRGPTSKGVEEEGRGRVSPPRFQSPKTATVVFSLSILISYHSSTYQVTNWILSVF